MPRRNMRPADNQKKAKANSLRRAAKDGFDEIDQGKGIVLKGRHAISRFVAEIETEVRTRTTKG
jgi:hypothetical protein